MGPGSAVPTAMATPAAKTPPMMSWPSPPTFTRPARAGTVTASAASTSGVPFTRMAAIEVSVVSDVHIAR